MSDLVLKPDRPTVSITIVDDRGAEHAHSFEVLPLTKPRFDAAMKFARQAKELEAERDTDEDLGAFLAGFCDQSVRSTNGPVTISSLWSDGLLPFAWVKRLSEYLQQTAVGDPPA